MRQEEAKDDLLASSDLLQAAQPNLLYIPQPGKTLPRAGNQVHNTQVTFLSEGLHWSRQTLWLHLSVMTGRQQSGVPVRSPALHCGSSFLGHVIEPKEAWELETFRPPCSPEPSKSW